MRAAKRRPGPAPAPAEASSNPHPDPLPTAEGDNCVTKLALDCDFDAGPYGRSRETESRATFVTPSRSDAHRVTERSKLRGLRERGTTPDPSLPALIQGFLRTSLNSPDCTPPSNPHPDP